MFKIIEETDFLGDVRKDPMEEIVLLGGARFAERIDADSALHSLAAIARRQYASAFVGHVRVRGVASEDGVEVFLRRPDGSDMILSFLKIVESNVEGSEV